MNNFEKKSYKKPGIVAPVNEGQNFSLNVSTIDFVIKKQDDDMLQRKMKSVSKY